MPHSWYAAATSALSVLALGVVGCSGGDASADAGLPIPTVSEVASPTGEGSAQPFVSRSADGTWLSWLEREGEGHALRVARYDGAGWSEARTVVSGVPFFVNWADFPSVAADGNGRLWAHWLQRGGRGTYDYSVMVAHSDDGGMTWSEPWTPHEDGTPQEHGFVTLFPHGDGVGMVWLDGRRYSGTPDEPASREMTVRFRTTDGSVPGPEHLLDDRACDCCQTDVALAASGPVVVYRDRSEGEIRDIAVTRLVDGAWSPPRTVHDDGWEIGGCPVNGPAVVADGDEVAVAWFTGAGNEPRVKLAFSSDGGASFGEPVVVDGGNPAGRVDLAHLGEGRILVSWLERTGGDGAEVRLRVATAGGALGPAVSAAASASARGSGFPRMAPHDDGVVLAWTDLSVEPSRVKTSFVRLP